MTFETTLDEFEQEHFTVVEFDLPAVIGDCTLGGENGFGTPLTCSEPTNGTNTYKFTNQYSPVLPESGIYRVIRTINEKPTELRSGRGLSARGSLAITLEDFKGDPNPSAPGITPEITEQGTFLGKLKARNIVENKIIRIKNYRKVPGQSINLDDSEAEIRYYVIQSLSKIGPTTWRLQCKDELSRFNLGEQTWPQNTNGFLRTSINATQTTFNVDPNNIYQIGQVVRLEEELCRITGLFNEGTANAQMVVQSRGSNILNGSAQSISRTSAEEHDAGTEIFICYTADRARIDEVLSDILTQSGVDPSLIPIADWQTEIDEWQTGTEVNTIFYESFDANKALSMMLESYMLDMWFDPVDREIKLSAINVWKSSTTQLNEGAEINYDSVKLVAKEDLRATAAAIVYDKPNKAVDNNVANYRQASIRTRSELEDSDFYGERKTKKFDNNFIIDTPAADLLVARYVSRYGITPDEYTWLMEEKKRTIKTGDVVDLRTFAKQGTDGSLNAGARAQILSIQPMYNKIGRQYRVRGLTYDPAFSETGTEIIITGVVSQINLYTQYAGAPASPVDITFVFDATISASSLPTVPSIRAGAFPAGSKITLIMVNGADLQAKGGDGGNGGDVLYDFEIKDWISFGATGGKSGGIVYDADGIDTDIYFSGSTPSAAFPTADGFIRAPGGGGGASNGTGTANQSLSGRGGNGGGGGAGRTVGDGGDGGIIRDAGGSGVDGDPGTPGTETGLAGPGGNNGLVLAGAPGGNWGEDGGTSQSSGGIAGSGIIDSGATVTLFGEAGRYINGNGDHP